MAMLMPGIPQIAAAMTYECARLIMPVLYVPLPEQKYLTKIHIKIHITTPRMTVFTATLSEVVVNCILHRSYEADSPIRIFIFDNRIEILSRLSLIL